MISQLPNLKWVIVINIDYFKWDDIYEDGLEERVQTAHDKLTAYYEYMDSQKFADEQKI